MKRIVTHMSLLAATAILATGCVPVRHNLPPEQRLMHPGPGVGGPGPGVLGAPSVAPGMMGAGMGGPMMGPGMGGPMMGAGMGGPMMGPGMGGPMMGPGMGGPMMGPGMGGPMMGPGMGGPMMGAPTPAAPPAAPMPDTSAASVVGDVDLVNYASCGPGCPNCGGAGCQLRGRRGMEMGMNIPPGGGFLPPGSMMPPVPPTMQVTLAQPEGMQVRYDATGRGGFDSEPLVVPARQNFPQGGLYRLKLTNIPAREGVELYPTVELAYANPRTGAYLAHNSVPLQFTEEDFDQVLTGNFVTKVIYLPDPDFQGPALAGIDTLVSTRLDPGIDPIVEADRRGSILAIIRLGDKDIEMSGTNESLATGGIMTPPIAGLPAAFAPAMTEGCGNCPGNGAPMPTSLPGMISGVNAPQYGMPMSATPIGLPGPPHIPLGHPAGLKKHVIRNHTAVNIPRPVEKVKMNVRMQPGYSYPNPVSRVRITEQNIHPGVPAAPSMYQQRSQSIGPNRQLR